MLSIACVSAQQCQGTNIKVCLSVVEAEDDLQKKLGP